MPCLISYMIYLNSHDHGGSCTGLDALTFHTLSFLDLKWPLISTEIARIILRKRETHAEVHPSFTHEVTVLATNSYLDPWLPLKLTFELYKNQKDSCTYWKWIHVLRVYSSKVNFWSYSPWKSFIMQCWLQMTLDMYKNNKVVILTPQIPPNFTFEV